MKLALLAALCAVVVSGCATTQQGPTAASSEFEGGRAPASARNDKNDQAVLESTRAFLSEKKEHVAQFFSVKEDQVKFHGDTLECVGVPAIVKAEIHKGLLVGSCLVQATVSGKRFYVQ